jgi:hypothetical protein
LRACVYVRVAGNLWVQPDPKSTLKHQQTIVASYFETIAKNVEISRNRIYRNNASNNVD